jgi:3-dehydroquinate synthase
MKQTQPNIRHHHRQTCLSDMDIQRFNLGFEYPVAFTHAVFDPANLCLLEVLRRREPERRHRVVVVVDSGVADGWPSLTEAVQVYTTFHARYLELVTGPLAIPGGELCKNQPEYLSQLHAWLKDATMDRQSFLIAIGGGALLDLAGFAAATTHRGIRLIRLPTTVLAQSDAGLGVKNGINAFGLKNFLGSFAPPFGVVVDFDFLATLDARDRRAGLAEAVKVAAIRDGDFFHWLEVRAGELAAFDHDVTEVAIRRCAALHLAQICHGGDPFEFGSARPLDFGHWAAHKLESLCNYTLRHGEAVAIGMALDARYAVEIGLLPENEAERLHRLLGRLGFRLWHEALAWPDNDGKRRVLGGIEEFREHLGGELNLTLPTELGRGIEVGQLEYAALEKALEWLQKRKSKR